MLGRFKDLPAILDLVIGTTKGFALTIETGASEAYVDLGGLPISRLTVKQGAGKMDLGFSTPNPLKMDMFSFAGGASAIEMTNLANANFASMSMEGGAAGYKLDFGGALQQDGRVRITAGVSSVEIKVPPTTAARITSESALAGVEIGDGFMKKEGMFWTEAALTGAKPALEIRASVTMGSLRMTTD
jgi:hypothetical protein